ncbi:MAG: hypothetical protein Fur0042_17000 [Cyanophyceae cyanobacterium]
MASGLGESLAWGGVTDRDASDMVQWTERVFRNGRRMGRAWDGDRARTAHGSWGRGATVGNFLRIHAVARTAYPEYGIRWRVSAGVF